MENQIILTRYLYIKDEVEKALLFSILEKNVEQSLFWAYELYHSGFQNELFEFLWKIYLDFFATLNQSFESYFLKKEKEWHKTKQDIILAIIIENLLIRPFNTDIFMLHEIIHSFEIEANYINNFNPKDEKVLALQVSDWIKTQDYRSISHFILEINEIDSVEVYEIFLHQFDKRNQPKYCNQLKKIIKNKNYLSKKILLTKIISLFTMTKQSKGKNLYMQVNFDNIKIFEIIFTYILYII